MAQYKPAMTGSIHPLPFERLAPLDFERMCLWLVQREGYERAEHLGLGGSEQGRDVVAYKPTPDGEERWFFQCKRYKSINARTLKAEVDKYLKLIQEKPHQRPVGVVFVVSSAASARVREEVGDYCEHHELAYEFWALTELDEKVKRHPDILKEFFLTLADGTTPTPLNVRPIAPPVPFVNREEARRELAQTLITQPGDVHTLVGLGGVGKTALAARVVHDVIADFPGGILWLSLEKAPALDVLWTQIVDAYGYPPSADVAGTARAALNQHRPLVVIDSAEVAPDVARELLKGRGMATVFVTARDRAVVAGYGGPPQGVESLPRADAVALFEARAGTDHDEGLVERLCSLLGDLPLAINLAAGYINSYAEPLGSYLVLLRDSALGTTLQLEQRRGMSVPVTFDLTYERLDENARLALAVLALDGGGTTALPAVAAGWEERVDENLVRRACNELVRRSMVTRRDDRYSLHPLVRRYAAEKGPDSQRADIRDRLIAHYLAYAQAHAQRTPADYDALEAELGGILAALDWAHEAQEWSRVVEFTLAMRYFLDVRGYWRQGRRRLEQGIEAAKQTGDQEAQAQLELALGSILHSLGQLGAAEQQFESSLQLSETIEDVDSTIKSLYYSGLVLSDQGKDKLALEKLDRGLDLVESQSSPNQIYILVFRQQIGKCYTNLQEYGKAEEQLKVCENMHEGEKQRFKGQDMDYYRAYTFYFLCNLYLEQNNLTDAREYGELAWPLSKKVGDLRNVGDTMIALAKISEKEGDRDEARRWTDEAEEIGKAIGHQSLLDDVSEMRSLLAGKSPRSTSESTK